jgi:hypothetical protein
VSKVRQTITFDFETELAAVRRRAARLEAAIAGKAKITEVKVKACAVRAHKREAHSRYVITLRGS